MDTPNRFSIKDLNIQPEYTPFHPELDQKFPIDTLRHHLQQNIGKAGFDLTDKPTDKHFPENN